MCNTFCSLINSVSEADQTSEEDGRKAKKREVADNLTKKNISMNVVSPSDLCLGATWWEYSANRVFS